MEETRRIDDLAELKAFAHPLRLKLYRALLAAGTATASQLAGQLGEAVSLASYHLRRLAAHGLIEEATGPEHGDGRERWWRVASEYISIRARAGRDDPETAAARVALTHLAFRQQSELQERYLDEEHTWPQDWRAAAVNSEYLAPLTAAELRSFAEEMREVLVRWSAHGTAARAAGDTEGRENVALYLYAFPFRS
jgi:DNA-binding transcriptional ArsR family regulator